MQVSKSQTFFGRTLPSFVRGLVSIRSAISVWQFRHATRKHLARLDPHMLRDIGMLDSRAEAAKPFWRA